MRRFAVGLAFLLLLMPSVHAAERERAIEVGGKQRTYLLVTPERATGPLPLLIVYHGGGDNPERALGYTRFDKLATSSEAIVVFPKGIDNNWNDGRVTSDLRQRAASSYDDVTFTLGIIDQLTGEGVVDASRVFATGASNGAMMSLRVGCEASERIAGIAPVAGSLPVDWDCAPSKPVPALFFNGRDDEFIPFGGGRVAEHKTRRDLGVVRSVDETLEIFRKIDGCSGVDKTETRDKFEKDQTKAIVTDYACSKARLRQVVVEGGGHTWPGARAGLIADMILGRTTPEIDATKEIWDFFKSLPPR
jgi:polyhydroxybutyrate depolymerase